MLNNLPRKVYYILIAFPMGKFFYKYYKGGKYGKWEKS